MSTAAESGIHNCHWHWGAVEDIDINTDERGIHIVIFEQYSDFDPS